MILLTGRLLLKDYHFRGTIGWKNYQKSRPWRTAYLWLPSMYLIAGLSSFIMMTSSGYFSRQSLTCVDFPDPEGAENMMPLP